MLTEQNISMIMHEALDENIDKFVHKGSIFVACPQEKNIKNISLDYNSSDLSLEGKAVKFIHSWIHIKEFTQQTANGRINEIFCDIFIDYLGEGIPSGLKLIFFEMKNEFDHLPFSLQNFVIKHKNMILNGYIDKQGYCFGSMIKPMPTIFFSTWFSFQAGDKLC